MKRKRNVVSKTFTGGKMRLQKLLAHAGIASRRQAEELIKQGRIALNGEIVVELGVKADPKTDEVTFDGEPVHFPKPLYLAFYKPEGLTCQKTKRSDEFKKTIWQLLPREDTLICAGRLDKQSEGLLVITNDGEFANIITHPSYKIEKTYEILVRGKISKEIIKKLETGVWLRDGKMSIRKITVKKTTSDNATVEIKISNRPTEHIREIFRKIGHPVSRITRTAIGSLTLSGLRRGEYRKFTAQEIAAFKSKAKFTR